MSDTFWSAFFGCLTPVLLAIIAAVFSRKLNHIVTLSNSMLSHTTLKKEEAEQKLERSKDDEIAMLRIQLAESNRTNALLTNAPKKEDQ